MIPNPIWMTISGMASRPVSSDTMGASTAARAMSTSVATELDVMLRRPTPEAWPSPHIRRRPRPGIECRASNARPGARPHPPPVLPGIVSVRRTKSHRREMRLDVRPRTRLGSGRGEVRGKVVRSQGPTTWPHAGAQPTRRTDPMPPTEPSSSGTIVVGVDGSDSSIAALRWACDLAFRIGSPVEAVTTWQWPMSLGPAIPFPADFDPAGDAQTMLEAIVQPEADRFPSLDHPDAGRRGSPGRGVGGGVPPRRSPRRREQGPWCVLRDVDRIGQPALRRPRRLPGTGLPRPARHLLSGTGTDTHER